MFCETRATGASSLRQEEPDGRTCNDAQNRRSGRDGRSGASYRGRGLSSTIWRTRLDTTTNWSVVTLGVALSITYSRRRPAALPLVLVGILIVFS